MEFILTIGVFVAGIIVGTQFVLAAQLALFVIAVFMIFKQDGTGVGGVIVQAIIMIFLAGIVVGDISYYFQTENAISLSNPFVA